MRRPARALRQPRTIELLDDSVESVGSFLEFLYTGEYFPKKIPQQRTLEHDPSAPSVDDTGDQLLKHARVYTLAEKFGVHALRTLASSKIHCVNSTAKGEIAYARYVYAYTSADDTTVRAPIASFWATRSHTLRSEAEAEFKSLCLEYPQFGYDVLSNIWPSPLCLAVLAHTMRRKEKGGQANIGIQPAFWTTSSRRSAQARCTLPHQAVASELATAAVALLNMLSFIISLFVLDSFPIISRNWLHLEN